MFSYVWFLFQMAGLLILIAIVLTIKSTRKTRTRRIRSEARREFINRCQDMVSSGEVNYLSADDVDRIVEIVKENNLNFRPGFDNSKVILAIIVFFLTGFMGFIFFILFFAEDFRKGRDSSIVTKDERVVEKALDDIYFECRRLSDSGEVNYFSIEEIKEIVNRLQARDIHG